MNCLEPSVSSEFNLRSLSRFEKLATTICIFDSGESPKTQEKKVTREKIKTERLKETIKE